jgi:hypothetical protein
MALDVVLHRTDLSLDARPLSFAKNKQRISTRPTV